MCFPKVHFVEPIVYIDSVGDSWVIDPEALDLDGIDPATAPEWLSSNPRHMAGLLFSGCRDAAEARRLDAGDFLFRLIDDDAIHSAQCRGLVAALYALRFRYPDCEDLARVVGLMAITVIAMDSERWKVTHA